MASRLYKICQISIALLIQLKVLDVLRTQSGVVHKLRLQEEGGRWSKKSNLVNLFCERPLREIKRDLNLISNNQTIGLVFNQNVCSLNPIPRIWMTAGGGVGRFVLHQVCRHFSAASEGRQEARS